MTYAVQAPLEVTWEAATGIPTWLVHTKLLAEVTESKSHEAAGEDKYYVRWRDQSTQLVTVKRDDAKKQIELSFIAEQSTPGSPGQCTIVMGPFGRDSTLVEAEIIISNSLANRLIGLLVTPLGIVSQIGQDMDLSQFWRDIAKQHREESVKAAARSITATNRVHVIAVGVNQTENPGPWGGLKYAEQDAKVFYELCEQAYPRASDPQIVRQLLLGRDASDDALGAAVSLCVGKGNNVQSGDMILFFFAGHIDLESDLLFPQKAQHAYIVTSNARERNLRWTGFKRDEVIEILNNSAAGKCLFICDACYGGGRRLRSIRELDLMRTRGRVPDRTEFATFDKTIVLAAAGELGAAAESDAIGGGLFTYALLKGLSGAGDSNSDGFVTFDELDRYLRYTVEQLSNGHQKPFTYAPPTLAASIRWPVSQPQRNLDNGGRNQP